MAYTLCSILFALSAVNLAVVLYRFRQERLRERAFLALAAPDQEPLPALRTIRMGDRGSFVTHWQHMLRNWGYPVQVDGRFGCETHDATRAHQRKRGLADDGIVGPVTWRAGP